MGVCNLYMVVGCLWLMYHIRLGDHYLIQSSLFGEVVGILGWTIGDRHILYLNLIQFLSGGNAPISHTFEKSQAHDLKDLSGAIYRRPCESRALRSVGRRCVFCECIEARYL